MVSQQFQTILKDKTVPLCMLAVFCITFSAPIINAGVYARIAPYFGIGRELSTFLTAVVFIVVAAVAVRKPSLFDFKQISVVVIAILLVAPFLLAGALELQNPALIMVGLLCRAVGSAWATIMFSVALTAVPTGRGVLVAVGVGTILSGLCWQMVPHDMPLLLSCVLLMLSSIIPILLTWRTSAQRFASIRQSTTASTLGVSEFVGFRTLKSLLLCMLMVAIAAGYSLTFNEVANAPVATFAEFVVVALAVLFVALDNSREESRLRSSEDRLFSLAALLIVAGFLVAPYLMGSDMTVANSLLRAGDDCFNLLIWVVLASIGRRNIFMLLPVLGAVRAVSSIGTDIGAVAGHVTNGLVLEAPLIAGGITTIFVFCFIAFLWIGFRDFNFATVINGVKPVTEPEILQIDDHIESNCYELGRSRGLTERETEILGLLAKGRDGRFIAEEYVLSYNTVKTHIKHIYAKLDVHSRQELIDLVGSS